MLCKGVLEEQAKKRACWLPANPQSSFHLCRRCHFQHITETVDLLTSEYQKGILHPPSELYLNDSLFLRELLHPAREQALLHLLATLFLQNKVQFQHLVSNLQDISEFPILMRKRIQHHTPGPRCAMYRFFLRNKKNSIPNNLCWNCWSCIAWILKQRDTPLLTLYVQTFGLHFSRLTHEMFVSTGPRVFVDLCVSLFLLEKHHHIRILFDHCLHFFPLEAVRSLVVRFLEQPPLLSYWASHTESEFLPFPFRDPTVLQEIRSQIKTSIKQRTDLYKEELVEKTWHPSRLFPWCLDIEELEDFGISSADRSAGIYGF